MISANNFKILRIPMNNGDKHLFSFLRLFEGKIYFYNINRNGGLI